MRSAGALALSLMAVSGCDSPPTSLEVCGQRISGDWLFTGPDWTATTTFQVTDSQITVSHQGGPDPSKYDLVLTEDAMTFDYRITSVDESRCEMALEVTYPPPNEEHQAIWAMKLYERELCWQQNVGDWEGPEQCYERL